MTQRKSYKIGDIVRLKSGGPHMTVNGYDTHGKELRCQWFAGSTLHTGRFDPDSVEPIEEADSDE